MSSDSTIMAPTDFEIKCLGEPIHSSPMKGVCFSQDDDTVLYHTRFRDNKPYIEKVQDPPAFEMAGPRERIFFDPEMLNCGIVTCGGLCPGLNDVIRAIVLCLHHHYGVKEIFGFRYGYEGLNHAYYHTPMDLTPSSVDDIHQKGGSLLGSSRGPQDPKSWWTPLFSLG